MVPKRENPPEADRRASDGDLVGRPNALGNGTLDGSRQDPRQLGVILPGVIARAFALASRREEAADAA